MIISLGTPLLTSTVLAAILFVHPFQPVFANHCPAGDFCGKTFPESPPPTGERWDCEWPDGQHHRCMLVDCPPGQQAAASSGEGSTICATPGGDGGGSQPTPTRNPPPKRDPSQACGRVGGTCPPLSFSDFDPTKTLEQTEKITEDNRKVIQRAFERSGQTPEQARENADLVIDTAHKAVDTAIDLAVPQIVPDPTGQSIRDIINKHFSSTPTSTPPSRPGIPDRAR